MRKLSQLILGEEKNFQELKYIHEIELSDKYISWININTDNYKEDLESLKEILDIPSTFFQYIIKESHRTRAEKYDNITFINSYIIRLGKNDSIYYEDINILLKDNYIITLNKENDMTFNKVMKELYQNSKDNYNTAIRLLLRIIYEIVDRYDDVFDIVENKIDEIDNELVLKDKKSIIDNLYLLRKNIIYIERYVKPYGTIVKYLRETTETSTDKKLEYTFKYVENTIENMVESIDISEELTNEIIDTINNLANEKTNDIMKTLTIWSTVFLPITFLAGVFGMNFKYMTGIEWEYAFHSFWIISLLIVIGMILYFKKKDY